MTMSDELKPCAHCAKPGIEVEQRRGDFHEWSIECSSCFCRTDWYGLRDAARFAWNQRADDNGTASGTDGITREASVIGTVDSGEADSRERLEADIREKADEFERFMCGEGFINMPMILGWLDRQASITERELCGRCSPYATAKDYLDTIDSLTAERDELDEMRERYARALNQIADALGVEITDDAETHAREMAAIEKLRAERDALKEQINRFNVPKSGEIAEVESGEADSELEPNSNQLEPDSREQLEEAMHNVIRDALLNLKTAIMHCVEQGMDVLSFDEGEFVDYEPDEYVGEYLSRAMRLLDRQAAITRREFDGECEFCRSEVARLQEKVDSLEEEAEFYKRTANRLHNEVEHLEGQLAELTAERDELRDKLREKQHVCDVQRDSFLKLEAENAELRRMLADAVEAI